MFKNLSRNYSEIRNYLDRVPVIDTHEHNGGMVEPVDNVLDFITNNYYKADMESALMMTKKDATTFQQSNGRLPFTQWAESEGAYTFEEQFKLFQKLYKKTNTTAYARGMENGLRECWGVEKIDDIEALEALDKKLKERNQNDCEQMMEKHLIKARIFVPGGYDPFVEVIKRYAGDGVKNYSENCKFAFDLPSFYNIHSKEDILRLESYTGKNITCLEDYLECIESYLREWIDFGIICLKDWSAYRRTIAYSNPTKSEAEAIFNDIIYSPREVFGDEEVRPLEDWLFHFFMRLAAKYELPVQIHTGHLNSFKNDIRNANAANFTSVLELHKDVKFDLFHGNWPYMDEYLYLGKNYPNVCLDLCWLHCIDPIYAIELMKRAIMTVPHNKIFAFGGDAFHYEWEIGYLSIARDNVACALSELVDSEWLTMSEAKNIAADWFFNNPNEFYKLGFEPFNSAD